MCEASEAATVGERSIAIDRLSFVLQYPLPRPARRRPHVHSSGCVRRFAGEIRRPDQHDQQMHRHNFKRQQIARAQAIRGVEPRSLSGRRPSSASPSGRAVFPFRRALYRGTVGAG